MATAKERFKIYDVVTATDISIQTAHANSMECPPTDELTILGFNGEMLVLSDGSMGWHHSHFYKVGRNVPQIEGFDLEAELATAEVAFNEFAILDELNNYIRDTYGEHYAKDGVQAFALIAKRPVRGLNFAVGNVLKYADRFGEKAGMNRKDLLKVAHYTVLALHCLDKLEAQQ